MTQNLNLPALSLDVAQAIAAGTHGDPFSVLGQQDVEGGVRLTVFRPNATTVTALTEAGAVDLQPVAGAPGVFTADLPARVAYQVKATFEDGADYTYDDPFNFGPVLGEMDEYLLGEGTHRRLWHVLGAHVKTHEGVSGTHFAVWAPNALRVSVVGPFNVWDGRVHLMRRRGATGVWETFLPGIGDGTFYKYEIIGQNGDALPLKADPVGFGAEHPPSTASVVRDISGYGWNDDDWMATRAERNTRSAPISIYEVHLGSWKRKVAEDNRPLSYKEAAKELVEYAAGMGFTHLEFLPLSEHPFDGSWGYQPVGLFAPTVRHGPPHEFRDLVNAAHEAGLGVILDWVPAHFPSDPHGLGEFDGTALYEHADPREGYHQDWETLIYNFGRVEVANFLISNALYWMEEFHIDALRVDAVASMLYRDYSRDEGGWVPNKDGGRENYEAIDLLRRVNTTVYGEVPGVMTVAEESTAFPGVSAPVDAGGLGFGFKWNMGWMNDTLNYIGRDSAHRKYHHHQLTFGLAYAYSENFILPISHDEVVHGKGSMMERMTGDMWQKRAGLRAYYGFMWGHPGKKLLFMGCEFGQMQEWSQAGQVDWVQASHPDHEGIRNWVRDLNELYTSTPSLYVRDCEPSGFEWVIGDDAAHSVLAWLRKGEDGDPPVLVICNFTPVTRSDWRIGVPLAGHWKECLNSDAKIYGGSGTGNLGGVDTDAIPSHGHDQSVTLTLPGLSTLILIHDERA